ncbi:MAG: cation diffusion facilitator family transporter [Elusimicrobiales bacterium]
MEEEKRKVVFLSIVSNTFLIITKISVGLITGSISIISEAIHSSIDLIAAVMTFFAIRASSIPPDKEHPYGHSKAENISGFVEALLIITAALWIIYESIKKLIFSQPVEFVVAGIAVMLFSAVVNFYVSKKLYKTSLKTDSIALRADAVHLTTDVYTSVGVTFGLFLIYFLEKIFPQKHFHWIDPAFAIMVAGIIIKTGLSLTSESIKDLMDSCISDSEIQKIEDIIKNSEDVIAYRNLKTRKAGGRIFIEFELVIDKNISFEKAHLITEKVASNIRNKIKSDVIIHPEPSSAQSNKD